jgi:amino acid transporter
MFFNRLFATKSLEQLHKEMEEDEGRLRRALGPISLTSLGIGAIIGAGIFVMTGRVAAEDAGPGVMIAYAFAGLGCALAAFCYAEFASMAPVAGSAYTYAYATLGELLAWIIGWDLILEYAMSAATVASAWSEYFNKFTDVVFHWHVPVNWSNDPISTAGAYFNLPAVVILALVTIILVIGIRESAISNTILVVIKLGVVIFVVVLGIGYISTRNWTGIPQEERILAEQQILADQAEDLTKSENQIQKSARAWAEARYGEKALEVIVDLEKGKQGKLAIPEKYDLEKQTKRLQTQAMMVYLKGREETITADLLKVGKITEADAKQRAVEGKARLKKIFERVEEEEENKIDLGLDANFNPKDPEDMQRVEAVISSAKKNAPAKVKEKWGLLGVLGFDGILAKIDDSTRSSFTPYGFSGVLLGAALVFFAFIGFDSISTHAEEAKRPQRDVPVAIIASLAICTVLYMLVSAVITGMEPYPQIDTKAAIAAAFDTRAKLEGGSPMLKASAALIAAGGLAGMTSVLLITFLSQARVFLAMARDGFMPRGIFGSVHAKFKTPHISTMVTGALMAVVAALTPIQDLEKMVNIGTLFAFVIVCGAVLMLRFKRPDVRRPFRCPAIMIVAPLGIAVNVLMMLALPTLTWYRLAGWLAIGLVIYFGYGYWNSALAKRTAARIEG